MVFLQVTKQSKRSYHMPHVQKPAQPIPPTLPRRLSFSTCSKGSKGRPKVACSASQYFAEGSSVGGFRRGWCDNLASVIEEFLASVLQYKSILQYKSVLQECFASTSYKSVKKRHVLQSCKCIMQKCHARWTYKSVLPK